MEEFPLFSTAQMIRLINCSSGKIHNVIHDSFLRDLSDKAVSRPHNQIQILDLYAFIASLLSTGLTHGSSLMKRPISIRFPTVLVLFRILRPCYFSYPILSAVFKLGMPNEEELGTAGYQ